MKTQRLMDGEGYALRFGEKFRFGCCDCGLTHDVVVVIDESEPEFFGFAIKQNKKATAARRRHIKVKNEPF